jgi:chromosome segregation ATPase
LRGKQEDVQAKLDKNCDRLKQQEATVAKLKADLAKAEAAHDELVTIIENQQQKVRELHTLLGSISDSDSEDGGDDADMDSDEDNQEKVRGVVGRNGRVTHTTDEARLASLLAVRPGTGAAALLRDERRAWADLGDEGDKEKDRRRDDRSRSPPQ